MIRRILLGLLAINSLGAQSPRRFDVVSVKPCKTEDGAGRRGSGTAGGSPGRLDLKCRTVMGLVQMAYALYPDGQRTPQGRSVPISGGPAWIHSERYDIAATAEGAPGQAMMSGPMMQALLEDRFQVKIHHETREVPVYALTVAKGGPKLQAAQPGKCYAMDPDHPVPPSQRPPGLMPCGVFAPSPAKDGVYLYSSTLAYFCGQLSSLLDRDVVDKTGIAGVFDIHVEAPPADPSAADSADGALGAAIFDAIQKVGLKLEPAKGQGEFLVIDHVERPTEN
jgi:uncharacterized protein (TIGR03435 family)